MLKYGFSVMLMLFPTLQVGLLDFYADAFSAFPQAKRQIKMADSNVRYNNNSQRHIKMADSNAR